MKQENRSRLLRGSFFFFMSFSTAMAQISDNDSIISGTLGFACGNTGGADIFCTGGNVPWTADPRDVINNRLTIESTGHVTRSAYGGVTYGDGDVVGNIVDVSGTVDVDVYGGRSSGLGIVRNNTAIIQNGGTVGEDVFGGWSTGDGDVTDNIVDISGSVGGNVVGGYVNNNTSAGNVSNNTVTLNDGAVIAGGVYGGITVGSGIVYDNTLNVNRFRGSVREINDFDHYNFDLPLGLYAGDTLIAITGSTATDLTGSTIAVSNQFSAGAFSNNGDTITLIGRANGPFSTSFSGIGYGGVSEVYNLDLHDDAGALVLELNTSSVNPQTRALSQWLASEIITLNRATDLITRAGLEQAKYALRKQGEGPALYTSASYADTRTKTGSHVDSDGWAGLVGLAWDEGRPDDTGWLASAFFEVGQGSFSAYNDFSGHNTVTSSGDTDYFGVGVFGHYRFVNRLRFDASARIGHVETDYEAKGYAGGLQPRFDLSGTYYSAHAGSGYDIDVYDNINLDLIARYLWTHRRGETVDVLGERIRFDSIDSHRVRVGGRLNYETNPLIRPYVGLYGEYEFDGKSKARNLTVNVEHHPLKIRGGTGIAEIGASVTPRAIPNVVVDLAVQGHVGRRDGVVGNVGLNWRF